MRQYRFVISILLIGLVHNFLCFPVSLRDTEKAIDIIADTEQWTGVSWRTP
jgi:hypothetical protein